MRASAKMSIRGTKLPQPAFLHRLRYITKEAYSHRAHDQGGSVYRERIRSHKHDRPCYQELAEIIEDIVQYDIGRFVMILSKVCAGKNKV